MSSANITRVAVAVFCRPNGEVLLAQRPQGKGWAGWWEFPGGKIEQGEDDYQALQREVWEELGCTVLQASPWITRIHHYPERTVELNFWRIWQWQGEPHGCENQQLSWQAPCHITVNPMLPANAPVLKSLGLPPVYGITSLEFGEAAFFSALQHQLQHGLRLIQVREKTLSAQALKSFAAKVVDIAKPFGAQVLLNNRLEWVAELGADGVHFSSASMRALTQKPADMLCACSCHNADELHTAAQLGLDFVVLSPVKSTLSHPDAQPMGWQPFAHLAKQQPMPVYALGGMQMNDLPDALMHGAHGIAMQRALWQPDYKNQ